MVRVNSDNLFGTTQYIVDANASQGSYTTIQAAVTAARGAGGGNVFIRAGTYTENVTMGNNVTLTGYSGLTSTATSSQTIISGSLSFTNITNCNVSNLTITGNGATVPLQFLGAGLLQVQFFNITVQASLTEIISCTNNNAGSNIEFDLCYFLQDGAFSHYSNSGSFVEFNTCYLGTSEGVSPSAVPSVTSGTGNVFYQLSSIFGGCQITGTGQLSGYYSLFDGNGIGIDCQTSRSISLNYCQVTSDTGAAAINIAVGGTVYAGFCNLFSTAATHAVTGSGTFLYDILSFSNSTNKTLDPALTITVEAVKPLATTAIPGLASFNPADFTVSSAGEVSTISAPTITWVTTSTNVANMSVATGYFCISPGGALTLGLPATSALGDTIRVSLKGATSWQVTQAAGQQIFLSSTNSTLGAGGSITSTAAGDSIELVCLVANTIWVAQSVIGNITVT